MCTLPFTHMYDVREYGKRIVERQVARWRAAAGLMFEVARRYLRVVALCLRSREPSEGTSGSGEWAVQNRGTGAAEVLPQAPRTHSAVPQT